MLRIVTMLFWLTISPLAQARDIASGYYKITLTIERGGTVIGTPVFVTAPGTSTIMTNDKAGYSFKVDVGSDGGLSKPSVVLSTELYLAENNRWERFGNPTVSAPIGSESEISVSTRNLGTVGISYKIEPVSSPFRDIRDLGRQSDMASRIAEWNAFLSRPVS